MTIAAASACAWPWPSPARAHARGPDAAAKASLYPTGAQYPRRPARPGDYVHASLRAQSAATGGTSVGAGTAEGHSTSETHADHGTKPLVAKKPAPTRLHGDPARALLAYGAMQKAFYIEGSGLYMGQPYSYLWPFSQALAATVSVADMPGQAHTAASFYARELHIRLYGLQKYWGPAGQTLPGRPRSEEEETEAEANEEGDGFTATMPSFNGNVVPPGGISYYDDNEWVGIELVRVYKLRREPVVLERAEQIMAFVMAGWQTNPKLACPGGVPFSDSPNNTDRNTITDAPAAELGVQLYWLTGNPSYLQFAQMAYQWVRACLSEPNNLYADHIRAHGRVDPTLWSYTQGAMIGAGAMLYQASHNGAYLYQARQTAKAALSYFTAERLAAETPFFPSVYFRNLMYLDSITHDPPGRRLAQAYVDRIWVNQRLKSNLFAFGSPATSQLLSQAAVTQIYALLSEPAARYF